MVKYQTFVCFCGFVSGVQSHSRDAIDCLIQAIVMAALGKFSEASAFWRLACWAMSRARSEGETKDPKYQDAITISALLLDLFGDPIAEAGC